MTATPDAGNEDLTRLRAWRAGPRSPTSVMERLRAGAGWLGSPVGRSTTGTRYAVDLQLSGSDRGGLLTFRKAALIEIGPVQTGIPLRIPISWQAAPLAVLFPVFSGHLLVEPGSMTLDGYYAPPGGRLGRAADRLLLHIVARRTAAWILDQIAAETT